jgi:hypothetical protein
MKIPIQDSQNSNQTYPKCKSEYCLLQATCLVMLQWMAKFPLKYIKPSLNSVKMSYEDVPESCHTHCWNSECEVGKLSVTKCHCITIFQVSLVSFAITTLSAPSQDNIFSYTVLQWLTWRNNAFAVCGASNSGKLSTNAGNTQNSLQSQCHGGEHWRFGVSFIHREIGWRLWVFTSSLHRQYTQKYGETLQCHQQWPMKGHFRNCWQVRSLIWKMLANSIGDFECAAYVCKVCATKQHLWHVCTWNCYMKSATTIIFSWGPQQEKKSGVTVIPQKPNSRPNTRIDGLLLSLKKVRHVTLNIKNTLVIPSECEDIIWQGLLPSGYMVNQHYYQEILQHMRKTLNPTHLEWCHK